MRTPALAATLALALGVIAAVHAQTPPAPAPAPSPPAGPARPDKPFTPDLAHLAFLEGAWAATDADGYSEERWSAPHGDNLMGCFRWCRADGTPAMFEMLAITREDAGVFLRLHHYSAALKGKEERDQPLTLRLSSVEGRKAVFAAHEHAKELASVIYDGTDASKLHIEIIFTPESKRDKLVFDLAKK
jgi:hypothetical protein